MRSRTANWYLKLFIGILFIAVIVWYTYLQSTNFLRGPIVSIETPRNGAIFDNPLITVSGSAEHVSAIALNGDPIFIDENGNFSQQLLLSKGPNIITVTAEDTFKRKVRKTVELIYD